VIGLGIWGDEDWLGGWCCGVSDLVYADKEKLKRVRDWLIR
jgi:hypothetical protein